MSNSFITNKEKFLSDIINGILPKTNAVDILVGYQTDQNTCRTGY